jgi:hypothetical protein
MNVVTVFPKGICRHFNVALCSEFLKRLKRKRKRKGRMDEGEKEKKDGRRKVEEGRERAENTNGRRTGERGTQMICTEKKEEEMNTEVKGCGKARE